jgi:hypothetical protein
VFNADPMPFRTTHLAHPVRVYDVPVLVIADNRKYGRVDGAFTKVSSELEEVLDRPVASNAPIVHPRVGKQGLQQGREGFIVSQPGPVGERAAVNAQAVTAAGYPGGHVPPAIFTNPLHDPVAKAHDNLPTRIQAPSKNRMRPEK